MLGAQYLENSWKYLATIANYEIPVAMLYGAVKSAILATAWLLVSQRLIDTLNRLD